mgnify:FL=1
MSFGILIQNCNNIKISESSIGCDAETQKLLNLKECYLPRILYKILLCHIRKGTHVEILLEYGCIIHNAT